MNKILTTINGSPHSDGHTAKAIAALTEHLKKLYGIEDSVAWDIPVDLQGCLGCNQPCSSKKCVIRDSFELDFEVHIKIASVVLIATPVYLDMPTAQTVAFLTRLNRLAESTGRKIFRDKDVHLLAVSYCSGTKSAIHTMMGACEMLGFNVSGRSTWEHCSLWKDNKVRGGMGASVYIKE